MDSDSGNTMRRSYTDAINALNSLQSNFAAIEAIRKSGINKNAMAMPEMREWTRRIGYKTSDFNRLNIIHVTGTKGKGSTCAFTQSILSQYQPKIKKLGLYTSPHLKSVRERITINGKPIAEDLFTKYFFEVWDRLSSTNSNEAEFPQMGDGIKPMYFKYLTLLSFHVFITEGVDAAIYEVGVGGEYDSTNLIEKPVATGVSALGIDHTFMLGNTLSEIAWNKGGIFKNGAKAFTVKQESEGMKVLEERAEEKQVELTVVDESVVDGYELGIPGSFQAQNAALAVALSNEYLSKLDIEIDAEKTKKGLKETFWAGRCQIIKDDKITWFIDGAHTKESIDAGSGWFQTATDPKKKRILLFNQQTRDANALVTRLHKGVSPLRFDEVLFTTNKTRSSGYSNDLVSLNTSKEAVDNLEVQKLLAEEWYKLDPESNSRVFHDIESSVNYIRSLNEEVDVFVCGSLHLIGGFLVVYDGDEE